MAFTTTRVTVYDSQIQAHFEPGGAVYKDAEQVGRSSVVLSRANVHSRTGFLASSITFGRQPGGRLRYTIKLNAAAPYAKFVEGGTSGIAPGRWLHVHPAYGGYPAFWTNRGVRGQRAQHFLANGMNAALEQHGYAGPF